MSQPTEKMDEPNDDDIYDDDTTIIYNPNIYGYIYDNINNIIINMYDTTIPIYNTIQEPNIIQEPNMIQEPNNIQELRPYLLYNTMASRFNIIPNSNSIFYINPNIDYTTIDYTYDIVLTDIQYNTVMEFLNSFQ